MKIIKRNGTEVDFNSEKIKSAIDKAFEASGLTTEESAKITEDVVQQLSSLNHVVSVEEVQDTVEECIAKVNPTVARKYIKYRYQHELKRNSNSTDDYVLSLIEAQNEEVLEENSNKNPVIASVQRDYMAGEVSKDLTNRLLLPEDIVQAHQEGLIHFHDTDYFAQHIHNCFSRDTKFVTSEGIKSFNDFEDGDKVIISDKDNIPREAIVHNFGEQQTYDVELQLRNGRKSKIVNVTRDHRWVLQDGTITTNLKVGDRLYNWSRRKFDIFKKKNQLELYYWCQGFVLGDGSDVVTQKYTCQILLCGDKAKYEEIFLKAGFFKLNSNWLYHDGISKEYFLNNRKWRDLPTNLKVALFNGYYAADGAKGSYSRITTIDDRLHEMIEELAGISGYYITQNEYIGYSNNLYDYAECWWIKFLQANSQDNYNWKVKSIKKSTKKSVWCVTEPVTHTFMLDEGVVTGNCDLVNLDDMLQNGTVISGTHIDKPRSFSTACNIATQIIAQVASSQYGGQTITLTHLAKFVDVSRQKFQKKLTEELKASGIEFTEDSLSKLVELRLKEEIERGVQTIQYQVVTLMTTNGQAPFISVFMYIKEADIVDVSTYRTDLSIKDRRKLLKNDLVMIIEEVLKQRIQGVKNAKGVWITPAFPKLLYCLDSSNCSEDTPYWYLTELAAKCTAKRMVPDYISEKKMLEYKGDVYPCMGCRSFLTPSKDHKYYGRFNQGVVTINLIDVALSSGKSFTKFFEIFNERLELCHRALRCRHERLLGTHSDIAPILWQHGALARLKPGETIDKLLYNGYSTLSLGYAGLYECVKYMTGESHTSPEGKPFAIKVMETLNEATKKWKEAENIDYSLYGTPLESTTYKFAKCLKKRFGVIEGITDKNYITNSYHVHVTEKIDAFSKLKFESEFQVLSPGGAISYVEVPNMSNNIPAVLSLLKYMYENTIYAEINTKSDYCQKCGFDGEIKIEEKDGKLIWKCPQCGCTDQAFLNVARRTCGYIGTSFWNQGRTQEIKDRVLHL